MVTCKQMFNNCDGYRDCHYETVLTNSKVVFAGVPPVLPWSHFLAIKSCSFLPLLDQLTGHSLVSTRVQRSLQFVRE